MPGMKAPDFLRLSAVSRGLNASAVLKKQKKIIAMAYSITYKGCPGDSAVAISRTQLKPSLLPNQPASVAGNNKMLDAKIGGITPAILNIIGKRHVCPASSMRHSRRLA